MKRERFEGADKSAASAIHYNEEQLVRIAKRENNTKRSYLVVNCLQGKYIPVSPTAALEMFYMLAEPLCTRYGNERLLLVGFAETATAIGALAAVKLGADYIQTTREEIAGAGYLHFIEAHSHAAQQKLVKDELDAIMDRVDRIIFIEDEVTTGNTILNLVAALEAEYGSRLLFSVASLINVMDADSLRLFEEKGIFLHYLVKTNRDRYSEVAENFNGDGVYHKKNTNMPGYRYDCLKAKGWRDARRLVNGKEYGTACRSLWQQVEAQIDFSGAGKVLVLGTEEFMFPALYVAKKIEEKMEEKDCAVYFHATGRSPIVVSSDPDYPLHERFELASLYEQERRTFLYNIGTYDKVFILTDANCVATDGEYSLINALWSCGNKNITLIRWER